MLRELSKNPIYLPSNFWSHVNRLNIEMIEKLGSDNFKRTVSQNYFNWLIRNPWDLKFVKTIFKWFRRPSFSIFGGKIENQVEIMLITHENSIKLNRIQRKVYFWYVKFAWQLMKQFDSRNFHRQLEEPSIGNPIRIEFEDKLISQDLANSIIEWNLFLDNFPSSESKLRIAELGGGYGRLAYVAAKTSNVQYFLFDIPPALIVAEEYLKSVFPEKKIVTFSESSTLEGFEEDFQGADIIILTANLIERFPQYFFDGFISISTLPELNRVQIENFVLHISRTTNKTIFLKQWKSWINTFDSNTSTLSDYNFGDTWVRKIMNDPLDSNFFMGFWTSGS